jgi:sec-independent protein translocase protein TatB
VARTLGHLFGRMQRYVNEVKADIQREVELDELKKLRESVEQSAREIEQSVNREFDTAEREMRELQGLVDSAAQRVAEKGEIGPEALPADAPPPAKAAGPDSAGHVDAALDGAALPPPQAVPAEGPGEVHATAPAGAAVPPVPERAGADPGSPAATGRPDATVAGSPRSA